MTIAVRTAKFCLTWVLITMVLNSSLSAQECLEKARAAITKAYPAGGEILKFTGVDPVFAPFVDCEEGFAYKLPNFLHEMVHFAGFKILGFGMNRIKVETSDVSRVFSARTEADLNDEGFFLSAKEKIEVRKFVSPPRKIIFGKLPETCRENPNFELYLSGDEAESGFLSLLDELNAYTHELRLVAALYPQTFPPGKRTVQKDNVLAFQLMVALYLAELRVAFPSVYKQAKTNVQVVKLTKQFWANGQAALNAVQDEKKYSKIRVTWPCVRGEIEKYKAEIEKFTGK
jgi:hypothetical protein